LKITVEAPASSANLGPGFDVFALALARPNDRLALSSENNSRLSVHIRQSAGAPVPTSAPKNGAGAVCLAIAKDKGIKGRILVDITKGVPIGIGMGSSGASAAAAAVAMNEMFNLGMSKDDMIFYAGRGERVTSGAVHYDNVSASVLGGFVVVKSGERPSAIRFDAPPSLSLCLVTPVVKLPERKTEYARSLIPSSVELKRVVSNVANASLIVSGFARGEIDLIGAGMEDKVVEEARKKMIPGYGTVKIMAVEAGAAGACISGAGPSMLAVVDNGKVKPEKVLKAMISGFAREGAKASGFVTKVGEGAKTV
jgi:homoserine kinase